MENNNTVCSTLNRIMAVKHPEIKNKLLAHRVEMEEAAMKANKEEIAMRMAGQMEV